MFRKLAVSASALIVCIAVVVGATASPAAAQDNSLPYGGSDCGTLAGPLFPTEVTVYVFAYRINGGQWVFSNWMASHRMNNWEHVGGGWQARQVNFFFTPDLWPGNTVDRFAYVHRASFSGWVNLGSCSQGGLIFN